MLYCSRGGLCYRLGKTDGAVFRNDNSVRARAIGAPDYRAEIVGILYSVKNYNEGTLALFFGVCEDILDRRVAALRGDSDNALMSAAVRKLVKLRTLCILKRYFTLLCYG